MWYWDYIPAGNYAKKPLSPKQLQKMKEAYAQADKILEHIRTLEEEADNSEDIEKKMEQKLDAILP